MSFVGWIKQNDIIRTIGWDASYDVFDQISVRIKHREASAGVDVLCRHGEQQRALSSARRADAVRVAKPTLVRETNDPLFTLVLVDPEHERLIVRDLWSCASARRLSNEGL